MTQNFSRRAMLADVVGLVAAAVFLPSCAASESRVALAVHKDPNCGCCVKWVEHMASNGFAPTVTNSTDMKAIKGQHKVTAALESCHTAIAGAYVIEGHVPAGDVKRLLSEQPAGIVGLTIPGMPQSAPGMDVTPFQPYTVLTFDADGKTTIFARHDKA